jgi:ABC transporter, ATP-binding protein
MFKKNQIDMRYINFINKIIIHDKKLLFISIIRIILGSFATLLIPFLNKIIIDNYIDNFSSIIEHIITLITLEFLIHIIIKMLSYKEKKYIVTIEKNLMSQLVEKYVNIENENLNEQYIDKFNKSKSFLNTYGISNAYSNCINSFQNTITIIGLVFLLDFFSLIIIFFLLIFTIINVIIKNKFNIKIYNEKKKLSPITRKLFYMFGIMWDNQHAKEIKMYKLDSWFKNETEEIINNGEQINKNIFKKNCILDFINNIVYIVQIGLIYVVIIALTLHNMISINNFTLYVSTITSFILCLKTILWSISELFNNSLYFNDYSYFIDKSKDYSEKYIIKEIGKIEFRNVSFRYSDSNENIINNLSFSVSKGEALTIVGKNGVGKSTVIKLLLRFLQPNFGNILINDYDLNDVDLNSYYEKLSCLFQNDVLFPYSLKDNISAFGFDENMAKVSAEKTLFIDIMKKHNLDFSDSFSNKLDGNGVNFSGGEIQQLLLTRTLYKNSELLIFDEPSSNLSQSVEKALYNSLLKNKNSNIIIMVSHRLGFCDSSDKILVLDSNGNTEYGNQTELLNLRGLYYLMYMKYYNISKN